MVPSARYASLSGFVEVTQALGLDPARLMTSVDLDPAGLARPDAWIPAAQIARLLELSAAAAECPDFGLRLAEHRALSALGPLSLILRDEPEVRSALQLILRYEHSYNESLRMRLTETNGLATVRLWFEFGEPVASRQADELAIGVLRGILGEFLGPDWRPLTAAFSHPAPSDLATHRRVLGHRLRFDHEFTGLVLYSSDLDTAINPAADRSPAVEEFLRTLGTARGESTADRAAEIIELLLPTGRCSAVHVAQTLAMDRRTLHRHLARSGTTFASLVDSTRAGLAERHLAGQRYRITEISELLGFAAPSAFTRWFRRHFDVTPTQWRRSAQTPPDAPATSPHTRPDDQAS